MSEEMRTFGYLCPKCGKPVMGPRSIFALEASDAEIACPDPNCGARFKITRVGKRIQSHGQCTVVPLMRPDAGKYPEN